ncbi:hypothetical protein K4F52_003359 [Lecanicillium sp. MT-2017a]|nr:hypothetical protein K4F52_003359 [Lecanicillium sp. MT-2017a]
MGAVLEQKRHDAILLFTSFYGEGHTGPLMSIASYMIQRGHEVVYVADTRYEEKITNMGAEFVGVPGDPARYIKSTFTTLSKLTGLERGAHQLTHVFYKPLPDRVEALATTLEMVREWHPDRQIIIVQDVLNMAVQPWLYGRPLPKGFTKFPKTVGISPHPMLIQSIDTAPILTGFPPDATESGRLRNAALHKLCDAGPFKPFHDAWAEALELCGCTIPPTGSPFTAWYTSHDSVMMLCSPSLEYDLSDRPEMIHFAGCLPPRGVDDNYPFPEWWSEIIQNSQKQKNKRRVVFVCQGTVNRQWSLLVEPTIAAFHGRDDIIVVASLGQKDASLDAEIPILENVRVADYLPYDAVLQHADVFVTNGGYGAFSHAVMNGVPAVFAGETEEKPEVIMRAVYAGFGHNLKTQAPSPGKVAEGVDAVLGDARYKQRAVELMEENLAMGALGRIHDEIMKYVE